MFVRTVVVVATLVAALLPTAADACGMPYRGGGELLVQIKAIQAPVVAEPQLEQDDNLLKVKISAERAALAQSVAERVAEVPAPEPQS